MPQLARITATFFTDLINRLGIRPPFNEGFEYSNVVTPVSIVDAGVTLSSVSSTITLNTPFTAGPLAAGTAANTVHADTGALAAGTYAVCMMVGADRTAGTFQTYLVQRRNAANAANIWEHQILQGQEGGPWIANFTIKLDAGERLRVLNKVLSNFTTEQVSLWVQQLG